MDITEISIIHHAALVLLVLWIFAWFGWRHIVLYLLSLLYIYAVNEHYSTRLKRRLQYEERKSSSQRRLLSDSESVRWLNHAVEKIWPVCMEQIASQQFLLPIIPWFLDKYKPWTVRKAAVQHLYLGRNPPLFTEIRVLGQSADDDHLVLELGMNFVSGDDMSAVLGVQLRKRVGFGISANMHVTGMHVEGKVLVGVKFLRNWPFIGRVRICFIEQPYFQMTVKPLFSHGIDVTELPGIAGWLDKLLAIAFEQTLVEPNMLVVDVEKFVSAPAETSWFTVDEKSPIAFAKVEVLEGADMKPSDMNGLADPYMKGQLGVYKFKTKIQKKTLAPKWLEEFKIPIQSWDAPNLLVLEVRDKDPIFDDLLGDCSININDLRGGQRHDKWLTLQNIKTGRVRLAITVVEGGDDHKETKQWKEHNSDDEDAESSVLADDRSANSSFKEQNPTALDTANNEEDNEHDTSKAKADKFEPIHIEGQERTGVWVHHPGSEVSKTWEPRKGRARQLETELRGEEDCIGSPANVSGHLSGGGVEGGNGSNGEEEGVKDSRSHGSFRRGLNKIGAIFSKSHKEEIPSHPGGSKVPPSPQSNVYTGEKNGEGILKEKDPKSLNPSNCKIASKKFREAWTVEDAAENEMVAEEPLVISGTTIIATSPPKGSHHPPRDH